MPKDFNATTQTQTRFPCVEAVYYVQAEIQNDILTLLLYLDTQHWVLIAMELIGIGCITPAKKMKLAAVSTTATH